MDDLEAKRKEALDKANDDYYNPKSPHYRDNERFSWAIDTINKKFDGLVNEP